MGSNFSWSNFLPNIPGVGGEYEGFSYLGLGGIIFFILLFFFFVRREPLLNFKKNRPYYLLVIIFFIIAISNKINFGSFVLLDISLPKFLYAPLSILRVSGRFVWPIYYLIFIAGLVLIYKKIEKKKNALLILIIILFIQIIDISSGLKNYVNSNIFLKNKKYALNDPIWNLISKDFQILRITYFKNSPNVLPQTAGILLNGNFKKTDIFALGRINRNKASIHRNKTYEHFRNNKLEKNTVFVINDKNHLRNLKFLFKKSDVLFRPKRSTLNSRSEVCLFRKVHFRHSNREWEGVPIIVSNMDTTGTIEMALALQEYKVITCLHKHYTHEDYRKECLGDRLDRNYYMLSTGITDKDWENLKENISILNPYFVCIDVANGYMQRLVEFVKRVREKYPDLTIACGNVVTREIVEELVLNSGVDIVKVGIGSGSVCTTRLQTGVGMPQLSAVIECFRCRSWRRCSYYI